MSNLHNFKNLNEAQKLITENVFDIGATLQNTNNLTIDDWSEIAYMLENLSDIICEYLRDDEFTGD